MIHVTRWSVALAAMAGLALGGCSDEKPKGKNGCSSDSDCDSGETCSDGTCVPRTAAGGCALCEGDDDCAGDNVCGAIDPARTACVPPCDTSAPDCPTDFHCADGFCIPDTGTCCIDEDGDGVGSGVDCTATDCDDTNPNCTDDCTDADSDDWCVGHDCDDAKVHCTDDCTDADTDDWCVGHDCNDNDGAATDTCVYCEVDSDGDGYGVGCPNGDDCDDLNPNCYEGVTCTDTDSDGWCDETDCADNNPHCDEDCTDVDTDGWCAAYDCDDANEHCTESCSDLDQDGWCLPHDCNDDQAAGGHCAADCTDADGDGYCVDQDCDDDAVTGPHCAEDCSTDIDTDGWCADQDCNDNDGALNADCSGCTVDNDGDGFGVGCPNGNDCDDDLPYCNVAPCTDNDLDGYCTMNDQGIAFWDCNDDLGNDGASMNPGLSEQCDGLDNDCDASTDNGDVPTMCPNTLNVFTTDCMSGACAVVTCSSRYYDVDLDYANGCECEALPSVSGEAGIDCEHALTVNAPSGGSFVDSANETQLVGGTIPLATRLVGGSQQPYTVWYTFLAEDDGAGETGAAAIDKFDVDVVFESNPNDQFELVVFRAAGTSCNTCGCAAQMADDTTGATFGDEINWSLTGQADRCNDPNCDFCSGNPCPEGDTCCCGCCAGDGATPRQGTEGCWSAGTGTCTPSTPRCMDHTARFFFGVRRRTPVETYPVTCDEYQISVNNGKL